MLLHVVLGVACAIVQDLFILWLALAFLTSINLLQQGSKQAKLVNLLYFITYFSSLELLARMTNAFRYKLPWEFGKYVVFSGAIYGILILNARKGLQGYLLFILLVPAMFFGGAGRDIIWHDIVFNLLGPISVALAVIAYKNLKITRHQFQQVLKLILYPAISVLAYTVFKTPDLEKLEFDLAANFATTGGYGSNQVSTVLGMGLFITFLFWVNRWDLTGNRLIDLAIMLWFAFQGLLSFSRGGMVGGGLGILIFLFMISRASRKAKKKFSLPNIGKYVLPAIIGLVVIFQVADAVTGGLLSLRYQGETGGTLRGTHEVDINTLTTGRAEIFLEDMQVWSDNLIIGAGTGVSSYLRSEAQGNLYAKPIASHVELSRLLAEHGLFGLTWFVVLLMIGAKLLKFNTNAKYQGILIAFFAIGVYTTFHAATRTYITPLLIGISLVQIIDIYEPELDHTKRKRVRS